MIEQNLREDGQPHVTKKGIWGWMFFDWAAQPFFTVVTTFIFGPYFVSQLNGTSEIEKAAAQATWGYGIATAGFIIAILSPVLGSIADQAGPRKPWIAVFATIKIIMLCSLWLAAPGSNMFWVVAAFTLASIAAEFSTVFNDSMMPRLVPEKDIGRVSNTAWGLGYAGGMIVLIFIILGLAGSGEAGTTLAGIKPLFGIDPLQGEDARASAPIAAIWYFIFILPMFFFTPDTPKKGAKKIGQAVSMGLSELKSTLKEVRHRSGILRFLVARMIYQDGVNALLALGGAFAAAMFGWSITEIGIFGILLNIVAIPSCLYAGRLDTRFGSKIIVQGSVIMLIIATIGIVSTGPGYTLFGALEFAPTDGAGLFGSPAEKAYILFGLLIGAAFGPVQASSRSYMARSVEPEEAGRYFGIYALSGRATSFAAPLAVALVTDVTGSPRLGMAMILIFLVIGSIILATAPYPAKEPTYIGKRLPK
ncbi:MAG: MFS transporter [Ahrensia sp.]|nr:MFS transporter [Ahrensia sp.]